MTDTTKTVLTTIYNEIITAYPPAAAYINLAVPAPAQSTGNPLAGLIVAAVAGYAPTTDQEMNEVLSATDIAGLYDNVLRRLDHLVADLATVHTALSAARPVTTLAAAT